MSEVRDKCVEFGESEKGLSSVISEYINKVPCLKISYQLASTDLKAVGRRNLKKMGPFFGITLFVIAIVIFGLVLTFKGFREQATDFYFFCSVIYGILAGLFIGPSLLIFKHFRILTKKLTCASEISVDLCFFKGCVLVRTSSFMSLVEYSSKNNEFIENDHDFIISYMKYPGTESIQYTFPKKFLDNEEIEKIREYAKKFEDRYIIKTKKTK